MAGRSRTGGRQVLQGERVSRRRRGASVHPDRGMGYQHRDRGRGEHRLEIRSRAEGAWRREAPESYEAERQPVAVRNTRNAAGFADSVGLYVPSPGIEDPGLAGEAARKRAGAYLANHGKNEFTIPGFTLGARYNGSPVILDDDTPRPPESQLSMCERESPGAERRTYGARMDVIVRQVWLRVDAASISDSETPPSMPSHEKLSPVH